MRFLLHKSVVRLWHVPGHVRHGLTDSICRSFFAFFITFPARPSQARACVCLPAQAKAKAQKEVDAAAETNATQRALLQRKSQEVDLLYQKVGLTALGIV